MNTTHVEQKNTEFHSYKLQLNYITQNYTGGKTNHFQEVRTAVTPKKKDGVVFREKHIGGFPGAHNQLLLSSVYITLGLQLF